MYEAWFWILGLIFDRIYHRRWSEFSDSIQLGLLLTTGIYYFRLILPVILYLISFLQLCECMEIVGLRSFWPHFFEPNFVVAIAGIEPLSATYTGYWYRITILPFYMHTSWSHWLRWKSRFWLWLQINLPGLKVGWMTRTIWVTWVTFWRVKWVSSTN